MASYTVPNWLVLYPDGRAARPAVPGESTPTLALQEAPGAVLALPGSVGVMVFAPGPGAAVDWVATCSLNATTGARGSRCGPGIQSERTVRVWALAPHLVVCDGPLEQAELALKRVLEWLR